MEKKENKVKGKITITSNWSGKLNTRAFTLIDLGQPLIYQVGKLYSIYYNDEMEGIAELIDIRKTKLDKLNRWITLLDEGLNVTDYQAMMKKRYKNQNVDWDDDILWLMLFKWKDKE